MPGCVTDGGLRDTNFILSLGFPCWGVFHTARDLVGCWLPTAIDVPIPIDDVLVRPGDWLHGDRDGMVCIPVEILPEGAEKSVATMKFDAELPFGFGQVSVLGKGLQAFDEAGHHLRQTGRNVDGFG